MKTEQEIQKYYISLQKNLQKELKNPTNIRNSIILQEKSKVIEWVLQ
jgi:hypothetical protein